MPTLFSRIVSGEIPSHKIAEDDNFYAFLDITPVQHGHTLVIPKQEIDYLFDMPDDLLGGITVFARPIAHAIRKVTGCTKVGVAVVGLEVPHAHVHLVPLNGIADMDFTKKKQVTQDELAAMAEKIRNALP